MALKPGDITQIVQLPTSRVTEQGRVVQAMQVSFLLRGGNRLVVVVDKVPNMAQAVIAAIRAEAEEILKVQEEFERG